MIRPLRNVHVILWISLTILITVLLGIGFAIARKYHQYYKHPEAYHSASVQPAKER